MTTIQDDAADTEDEFLDDPLLNFYAEEMTDEPSGSTGRVEVPSSPSEPTADSTKDEDPDSPSRKLPDDLFLVRKAKESLFRVLGIAADSRTIFTDDLTVIWNQITLPGDPPAVLMQAELYLVEWLRYHVCVVKQNSTTASDQHIRLIETFQKGANSACQQLMNLGKQILTIRKMLANESPTSSTKKPSSVPHSSKSQPKMRKPKSTEDPTHNVQA